VRSLGKRFFCFCLFSFSFTLACFAYTIEPYAGQPSSSQKQESLKLVFCPLNYSSKEDFLQDTGLLIQRLKKTPPFAEVSAKIGFYYTSLKEEEKPIFKEIQGFPPLGVRRDFLEGIRSYLKSGFKLVIIDASGFVSCAEVSSIDKLSLIILGKARYVSRSGSLAKEFLHELGHSLGLRDECADCGQFSPQGRPNCAVSREEAQSWWGDLVGRAPEVNYIRGCCGNKNYIRPTVASLMNNPDKSGDFGAVNERYLKNAFAQK
jgi:hypothetical protein